MTTQRTLFPDPLPAHCGPSFGGSTFSPALDGPRLETALGKVYQLMKDGRFRTLAVIALNVGCSEAGASARLRDLRKVRWQAQYPNNGVERRRRSDSLWEYRMK